MNDDPPPTPDAMGAAVGVWSIEEIYDPDTVALIDDGPGSDARRRPPLGTGSAHAISGARPIDPTPAPADGGNAEDASDVPGPEVGDADVGPGRVRSMRSGVAGLALAGMMVGVGEALAPDRLQPEMVEFSPDIPDPSQLPVQFIHVPGDPQASRLIIRPWLFR